MTADLDERFVDAKTDMGETVVCDECEAQLELVGLDPFELDPVAESDSEYGDGFNIFENED